MAGTTSGVIFKKVGTDLNITQYQGKTVNFDVIWGGSAPEDVTGYSAKMQARKGVTSTEVLLEFNSVSGADGLITVGTTDGKFTFSMPAVDSAAITPFCGVYDFEITSAAGVVVLVFSGRFEFLAEVTK